MNTNLKLLLIACITIWSSVSLSRTIRAEGPTIYVAPGGNDAWSGKLPAPSADRSDGPVATPEKARDLVRALLAKSADKPIHVELRGGTYFLDGALTLTPADSGTEKAPVIWSAYQGEHPVVSGGVRVTGWKRTKVNGQDAWVGKLPGGAKAPLVRELWLDGVRLTRSRWPKHGTFTVVGLSDKDKHNDWSHGVTEFRFAGSDLKAWPTATDGEAIVASRWVESHLPIKSIDEAKHVVQLGKRSVFVLDPGDLYWIENVKEHLTKPGEFYVNPREKTVYLITPPGRDPNKAHVIAPRLAEVLRLLGKPESGQFVEHVMFRGITFAHTEWYFDHAIVGQQDAAQVAGAEWSFKPDPTKSGFGQAAIGVPGALWGRRALAPSIIARSPTPEPTASNSPRDARRTTSHIAT
ncbi:MAG: hypothetical protein ACP5XB_23300 [Isosphaeraceae bacterium]